MTRTVALASPIIANSTGPLRVAMTLLSPTSRAASLCFQNSYAAISPIATVATTIRKTNTVRRSHARRLLSLLSFYRCPIAAAPLTRGEATEQCCRTSVVTFPGMLPPEDIFLNSDVVQVWSILDCIHEVLSRHAGDALIPSLNVPVIGTASSPPWATPAARQLRNQPALGSWVIETNRTPFLASRPDIELELQRRRGNVSGPGHAAECARSGRAPAFHHRLSRIDVRPRSIRRVIPAQHVSPGGISDPWIHVLVEHQQNVVVHAPVIAQGFVRAIIQR